MTKNCEFLNQLPSALEQVSVLSQKQEDVLSTMHFYLFLPSSIIKKKEVKYISLTKLELCVSLWKIQFSIWQLYLSKNGKIGCFWTILVFYSCTFLFFSLVLLFCLCKYISVCVSWNPLVLVHTRLMTKGRNI